MKNVSFLALIYSQISNNVFCLQVKHRVLWIIKAAEGTPRSDNHPSRGQPSHFILHQSRTDTYLCSSYTVYKNNRIFILPQSRTDTHLHSSHTLQKQLCPYPTPVKNRTDTHLCSSHCLQKTHLCSSHCLQKQLCPACQVLWMNNHIYFTH